MYQSLTEFLEEIAENTESYIGEMLADTCEISGFQGLPFTNQDNQIDWGTLDIPS